MQQWLYVTSTGQQVHVTEAEVPNLIQNGQITPQTLMWRDGLPQWVAASSAFAQLFPGLGSAVTQPLISTPKEEPAPVVTELQKPVEPQFPQSESNPLAAAIGASVSADPASAAGAFVDAGVAAKVHGPITATPGAQDPSLIRRLVRPLDDRKGWIKFVAIMTIISGVFLTFYIVGIVLIFAGVALLKVNGDLERAKSIGDADALESALKNLAKYTFLQGIFMLIYLLISLVVIALVALMFLGVGIPALSEAFQQRSMERSGFEVPTTAPAEEYEIPADQSTQ